MSAETTVDIQLATEQLDVVLMHADTLLHFVRYQSQAEGTSEHAYTFNMIETVLEALENNAQEAAAFLKEVRC